MTQNLAILTLDDEKGIEKAPDLLPVYTIYATIFVQSGKGFQA
jgi:hypothetical protein